MILANSDSIEFNKTFFGKPIHPCSLFVQTATSAVSLVSPFKNRFDTTPFDAIDDISLDEEIEVGFFDNLKTPQDELKLFSPLDDIAPSMDGHTPNMFIKSERPKFGQLPLNIVDSLSTPVVNPDSQAPIFQNVDVEYSCMPMLNANDFPINFEPQHTRGEDVNSNPIPVTMASNQIDNGNYYINQYQQQQPEVMPINTPPFFQSNSSNTVTPSSSSSSMTYTELRTKSPESLVPTVVQDHSYQTRDEVTAPFGMYNSVNSPAPSTSSHTSNTSFGTRERSHSLSFPTESNDETTRMRSDSTSSFGGRCVSASAASADAKKSRVTKRVKLNQILEDEKRLISENQLLKVRANDLERKVGILKQYVTNVLKQTAPSI